MGLDYSLKLATDMKRIQALGLLAERIPELQWSEEHTSLYAPDIIITVVEMDGMGQSIIEEGFGFRPSVSVGFRYPSNRDYENFAKTMLRGALPLLEQGRDGVLLFNGEIIVLQRIGGRLVFNADYRLYRDERWLTDNVPVPFERRPLPSPLR
ncbi:SitI3 family protein [Archangium lansingense]|uniref:SitI3 family protein n=1 Tax=Archangium lansingense TaxID=2995310 RepID=A0ABT4ALZ4_9BACT|nr:SitI3 family protein [Archangium lansinium]MCY1082707.1 SitI3 family protein [Archangium lansinium]